MAKELEKITNEILSEMDTIEHCCRPIVEKLIYVADIQAQEMDRLYKAVGLHDENISTDDAISIILKWKNDSISKN